VAGHILGFTDVDDGGQEGLELAFDHWLAGEDGAKRVIQDNLGRTVQDVESIRPVRPGRDLTLSIDLRIQYLAYRELKAAIRENRAKSRFRGGARRDTGEVLAMVNQPDYNPNDRDQLKPGGYRNRAATDILEPGSSIKPFVVAAALASGKYTERSVIDTSPASTGRHQDHRGQAQPRRDQPVDDPREELERRHARVALALEPEQIYATLSRLGFGQVTTSGYPRRIGRPAGATTRTGARSAIATLAYGYGLSVTPLQLAHAYATIGSNGVSRPISFLRVDQPVAGERVFEDRVGRSWCTCSSRW